MNEILEKSNQVSDEIDKSIASLVEVIFSNSETYEEALAFAKELTYKWENRNNVFITRRVVKEIQYRAFSNDIKK